jgi:hypothetical protein
MVRIDEFDFEVQGEDSYAPIPAGEFCAAVVESDQRQTKSGDGMYLRLTFEITEGQYKGRRLWENYNLWNKSDVAVKIAKESLAKLIRACGKKSVVETTELHGVPVTIVTKLQSNNMTGDPETKIKGYKSCSPIIPGVVERPAVTSDDPKPWD